MHDEAAASLEPEDSDAVDGGNPALLKIPCTPIFVVLLRVVSGARWKDRFQWGECSSRRIPCWGRSKCTCWQEPLWFDPLLLMLHAAARRIDLC